MLVYHHQEDVSLILDINIPQADATFHNEQPTYKMLSWYVVKSECFTIHKDKCGVHLYVQPSQTTDYNRMLAKPEIF